MRLLLNELNGLSFNRKYLSLFSVFLIGISCVTFSIYEYFSSSNVEYKESDFIQIKSQKCSSIKHHHHGKQTPIIRFKLCNFPSVSFISSNRILTEDRIDDLQNQIGDTLSCLIEIKDYCDIFNKKSNQNIFKSSNIKIYSLRDENQQFLTLNIDNLNKDINTNKMLGFYFFGTIGIVIIVYGFRKLGEI